MTASIISRASSGESELSAIFACARSRGRAWREVCAGFQGGGTAGIAPCRRSRLPPSARIRCQPAVSAVCSGNRRRCRAASRARSCRSRRGGGGREGGSARDRPPFRSGPAPRGALHFALVQRCIEEQRGITSHSAGNAKATRVAHAGGGIGGRGLQAQPSSTWSSGRWPSAQVRMFAMTRSPEASRPSSVALPRWGWVMTLGWSTRRRSTCGSSG